MNPLFFFEEQATRSPALLIITGASGAGKTTWCDQLRAHAVARGMSVGGLLSPAVFANGEKVAIDLLDVQSGERRRLASRRRALPGEALVTGDWSFDLQTVQWGNEILSSLSCPDLLFVDELGPLEFHQEKGLRAGIALIDAGRCNLICTTIRPALLGAARMRWPWSQLVVLDEGVGER